MRRLTILAGLFLALFTVTAARAAGWPGMDAQIDQTNFLVNDNCSATLIDVDKGYLLTANHCIAAQYRVIEREKFGDDGVVTKHKVRVAVPGAVSQLVFKGPHEVQRNTYVFKIVLTDTNADLALIQVQAALANTQASKIACTDPRRGDTVYVVGNPYGVLYSSVTKGIVSSLQRNYPMIGVDDQGDNALMQVSSGVIGGNSGGAAYNASGELIGVPVRASSVNEVVGLVAPLSDIKKMLTREGLDRLWARCAETK